MTKSMIKGEKAQLSTLMAETALSVGITCQLGAGTTDISCFGVDANGKLSDDRYFIFYNQRQSPEKAIEAQGGQSGYDELFSINLKQLPSSIVRLVFVATIDGPANFSALSIGKLDFIAPNNSKVASYQFSGSDFSAEKAIIIAEIYLKTVWRVAAVSQGFNGGLSALLKHFGGEEIAPAAPVAPAASIAPAPASSPPPPPPPVEEPKVKLSKVRLDKPGESHRVHLSKGGSASVWHINLQWDQPNSEPQRTSFLGRLTGKSNSGAADLDLGCMWRDIDGNKGVIQPLGGDFGSKTEIPYIFLDKDDRSGAAADGENMHLFRPERLELIVIFTMVYEGAANFSDVNARLTIFDGQGSEVLIPLNAPDLRHAFCAVATIRLDGGAIKFQKEERYFAGHRECDQHYGFNFSWTRGRK